MAQQGRSVVPLVVAGLVGVLLIVLARMVFSGDSGDSADPADPGSGSAEVSEDCTEIIVVASSEKAGVLQEAAGRWNSTSPEVDGVCVGATVVTKSSGAAATALSETTWNETIDGPRPDVWSPASSSWGVLVRQWRSEADLPDVIPSDFENVAQTPLVVAMPRPMAEALGWPDKSIGWADLSELAQDPQGWASLGHPEWGSFRLGKTNPNFSTSGLNATIAAYFAATGLSSDLSLADVRAADTRQFVSELEASVVHYGDTTLTFLDNMAAAAAEGRGLTYVSAVTVEEKSVLDYNEGNPTGDPATAGDQEPPAIPLVAVYPSEGTLLSDNPWLILDAEWVDETKRGAAQQFIEYIQSDETQQVFTEAGFRTFNGEAGATLTQANGFIPEEPTVVLAPPAPAVLAEIQQSWDELRKRARVLMVLDVSGSMGAPVPEAGASRLELASDATASSVEAFADDDEIGLWVFSTQQGPDGEPYREAVAIAPAAKAGPEIAAAAVDLVPTGGTGLYATVRAAQEDMLQDLDVERINAIVVLSDGRNEYPADTDLEGLLEQLSGESVDTSVRVFTIGYGDAADVEALELIAEASSAAYYDASDPTSIDKVLTSVLSNF